MEYCMAAASSPLAPPPELLKQHIAETGVRFVDADGVHKLFDVMIHDDLVA